MKIDDYILPEQTGSTRCPERERISGMFLKGPVPLAWIQAAYVLDGTALATGLVLRMFSGINYGGKFPVSTAKIAAILNVSEKTVSRSVKSLVNAGLILVSSSAGCRNEFEIVEV